ncbi:hypothetical protein D3C81_1518570 [compost metagenome]
MYDHSAFHTLQNIDDLHHPFGGPADPQLAGQLHPFLIAADALDLIARALQHGIKHLLRNGEIIPMDGVQAVLDFRLQLSAPAALSKLGA